MELERRRLCAKTAWEATQTLIADRKISAGHDVSDGGIVTAVLEMAFPHPDAGVEVTLPAAADGDAMAALFSEELAIVIEVSPENAAAVAAAYAAAGVTCTAVGKTTSDGKASVSVAGGGDAPLVAGAVADLRDTWERTSFALERLQSSEKTVAAEEAGLKNRKAPVWNLTYTPEKTSDEVMAATDKVKVAILREEGSNGDREMVGTATHHPTIELRRLNSTLFQRRLSQPMTSRVERVYTTRHGEASLLYQSSGE